MEKPFANDFDKVVKGLMTKYKPPDTALDFSDRQSSQLIVFDPNKMSAKNYVEEMHQFLYREEKARSDKLCGSVVSCYIFSLLLLLRSSC